MTRARYVMVGGFLGAGKTTAIVRMARMLSAAGQRVGLISNDQSRGLVDTALMGSGGFAIEEITGGCFCCRFGSLVEAAQRLTRQERPDVLIAEPVGSCTDLKATVDYPLRRLYGEAYAAAPLSVMVDPVRAMRILGLAEGRSFSPRVQYIYLRQLEEAELIVINKVDLLTADDLSRLADAMRQGYPNARVIEISARGGMGMEAWLDELGGVQPRLSGAMDVDYVRYAEGEALLGWLNATVALAGVNAFDGNALLFALAERLRRELAGAGVEIAHLKMTLEPEDGPDIGAVNVVSSDAAAVLGHALADPLDGGTLLVNLRAESAPGLLREMLDLALAKVAEEQSVTAAVEHVEAFSPSPPRPTHRLAEVGGGA